MCQIFVHFYKEGGILDSVMIHQLSHKQRANNTTTYRTSIYLWSAITFCFLLLLFVWETRECCFFLQFLSYFVLLLLMGEEGEKMEQMNRKRSNMCEKTQQMMGDQLYTAIN